MMTETTLRMIDFMEKGKKNYLEKASKDQITRKYNIIFSQKVSKKCPKNNKKFFK